MHTLTQQLHLCAAGCEEFHLVITKIMCNVQNAFDVLHLNRVNIENPR